MTPAKAKIYKWVEDKMEWFQDEIDRGGDYRYLDAQNDILEELRDWIDELEEE